MGDHTPYLWGVQNRWIWFSPWSSQSRWCHEWHTPWFREGASHTAGELGVGSQEAEDFCSDLWPFCLGKSPVNGFVSLHLYSIWYNFCLHTWVTLPACDQRQPRHDGFSCRGLSHHRSLVCASVGLRWSSRSTVGYFRTNVQMWKPRNRSGIGNTYF